MVDAFSTPVAILDEIGCVIGVNRSWREVAGRPGYATASCGPGDSYPQLCDAALEEGVFGAFALKNGLRRVLAGVQRTFQCDCRLVHDGSRRHFRVRISHLDDHTPARFLVEHEDVTVLAQAQETLREVGERILEAQEAERQRFAVELHDAVGQNLVSVGLSLSLLRMLAPKTSGLSSIIGDMSVSLQEAQAQIRSLSYLLNPPWPEHGGGLEKAARELVQGFGRRAGLRVEVRLTGPACVIDRSLELTVFRILQEALVNVHRHAHANAVVVELANRGDELRLQVRDDGRGFAIRDGAAAPLGVGLSGMRARVMQRGGDFAVVTGPTGTTLTVRLPTKDEGAAALADRPTPNAGAQMKRERPGRVAPEARSWRSPDARLKPSSS